MNTKSTENQAQGPAAARVSDVLIALFDAGNPDDRVTIADLIGALHERAMGIGILLFALPNALPLPGIPGVSAVLGAPLILLALQLAVGRRDPWLPQSMLRKSLRRGDFARLFHRILPGLLWLERAFKPRMRRFTAYGADRVVAFAIAILGAILALPIIFGNLLPAWAIILLALGLIEEDGLAVLIGSVVGVLAVAWNLFLVLGGVVLVETLIKTWF